MNIGDTRSDPTRHTSGSRGDSASNEENTVVDTASEEENTVVDSASETDTPAVDTSDYIEEDTTTASTTKSPNLLMIGIGLLVAALILRK